MNNYLQLVCLVQLHCAFIPNRLGRTALIRLGIYEHYKGQRYQVLGVAQHTETLEELVVYQALYGNRLLWARPVSLFNQTILQGSQEAPRFQFISEVE